MPASSTDCLRRLLMVACAATFVWVLACEKPDRRKASPISPPSAAAPDPAPTSTPEPAAVEASEEEKTQPPAPPAPPGPAPALPSGHPPIGVTNAAAASKGGEIKEGDDATVALTGLVMTAPVGWIREPVKAGGMGPVAVFRLPGTEGDDRGAGVRITYFPGMKGLNDLNIDRWVGQVLGPNGQPMKREDAKIATREVGGVTLTIVDITGGVTAGDVGRAAGAESAAAGERLITAIVDHPEGPHFVKVAGSSATLAHWEESIHAFLDSAKVK